MRAAKAGSCSATVTVRGLSHKLADSANLSLMNRISVRVEKSGRILIPAAIRRQLGLKEGESDLLLDIDQTPVVVTTRAQALARIQEWAAAYAPLGRVVSEDLIDERHREAAKELGE